VDAIIDALLGSHQTLLDLPTDLDRQSTTAMILWAGSSKSTLTLSIDMPSGVHAATGYVSSPLSYIRPKWTVAMGLPKTGHLRAAAGGLVGDLFLADVGVPRSVFMRMGRLGATMSAAGVAGGVSTDRNHPRKYSPPFGDKYLVGLVAVDLKTGRGDGDD
ncbi:YjeF N-terminal domain-containing protein, partial [Entophlyctis helioformis]